MNCCCETMKMDVPPGNRPAVPRDWFRGVPEWYVAGADARGRQEGRPYPWSQQVIYEISGLGLQKYVYTKIPQHEVPTGRAEEREFSIGTIESDRVVHDAVGIHTVFKSEGMSQFVNGLLFKAIYQGRATNDRFFLRISQESITGDHGALALELSFSENIRKDWTEEIDTGNSQYL